MREVAEGEKVEIALQLPEGCRLYAAARDYEDESVARYLVSPARLYIEVSCSTDCPQQIWVAGQMYGQREIMRIEKHSVAHSLWLQYRKVVPVPAGGLI